MQYYYALNNEGQSAEVRPMSYESIPKGASFTPDGLQLDTVVLTDNRISSSTKLLSYAPLVTRFVGNSG